MTGLQLWAGDPPTGGAPCLDAVYLAAACANTESSRSQRFPLLRPRCYRRLLGKQRYRHRAALADVRHRASVMPGMFGMSAMPGMPAMTAPMLAMGTPAVAPRGPDAVDINNFTFTSVTLTVPVGVTVTSTNRDKERRPPWSPTTGRSIRLGWIPTAPTRSPSPDAGSFDCVSRSTRSCTAPSSLRNEE